MRLLAALLIAFMTPAFAQPPETSPTSLRIRTRAAEGPTSIPPRALDIELRQKRDPMADPCPTLRLGRSVDMALCSRDRSPIASPFEDDPIAR